MTTLDTDAGTAAIDSDVGSASSDHEPSHDGSTHSGGPPAIAVQPPRWSSSTDHKVTGQLYLTAGLFGLLAAIAVNVVLGFERLDGADVAFDDGLSQLFDAQRVGLVFGAALPLALGACVAFVPLQLGARAIAFPRLTAAGFWMWLGGLVLNLVSLAGNGGTLGGDADMVDLFIASLGLMAIGATATAGSIATSVLTTRAPGMTMRRVPFFSWSALVTAISLMLVMPVFLGTIVYLFLDHRNGRTGFGGNSGIYSWVGWMFSQPVTYVFAIPAIGAFADMLPVTFKNRTPARGVMIAGLALLGVAALSGVSQQNVHALPWSGSGLDLDDLGDKVSDLVPFAAFYLLPLLGMVVVLLMALVLAKPQKGVRPNLTPGVAFGFFGYGMLLVGMLGTALWAIDDLALQGTVFEEASLVYIVYGAVLGTLGGLVFWAPKLWGAAPAARKVIPLALLGVLATVLSSFPHYVAGYLDQPAGAVYDNDDLVVWNILVLVGHALMGLTVLAVIGLVAAESRTARHDVSRGAGDDPWGGHTLEWATTSPAPDDNFVDVPLVRSAEPLLDLRADGSTR
jgi:heme/copper-type cytochrome/quinol oxidase subunit 1